MSAKIKLLAMDVDGTLTDGKVFISGQGEVFKVFNVIDGYGINVLLRERGVIPVVLALRESDSVERRCKEIGISHIYQNVKDKRGFLCDLIKQLSIPIESVAYIGDDDNDLEVMRVAALVGCPADASARVLEIANFISEKKRGDGVVREFIEWMIAKEYI